jgi:predicted ATP-grasp superfamily ATP-dependent carboligase
VNITLKKPLVYVARDIERALGMEPGRQGGADYFVVSNDTPYGREVQAKHPDHVILVGRPADADVLDTFDLLSLPEVQNVIDAHDADVLVFQNTPRIERLCVQRGWRLLNPSAELARRVEEKVSQVAWLAEDAKLLPPFAIATAKDVAFAGKKFVLQWNHAHTGEGTHIIESAEQLQKIKDKFQYRECRVTDFIDGPVFTVNAVVGREIAVGNPSYQITGLAPFTDLPFSTVGNDFALPQKPEYESLRIDTVSIAQTIGARLKKFGWKGLFGIDVIYDPKTKKTYLLEINARQAASAVFESKLQGSPSIFEAHVAALIGESLPSSLSAVSGAQIVQRVTNAKRTVDVSALRAKNLSVMEYQNDMHNKELFRIQSAAGIMKSHGTPNDVGTFISSCIN